MDTGLKFRKINEHLLLDSATADSLSAIAYPISEAEGIYFWSRILERFGLVFVCAPAKQIAPDAYFAVRSRLAEPMVDAIEEGLRNGSLPDWLIDDDVVVGVEFESKASYAKKHFENDGAQHITLICCIDNDWSDAPVPVWSLQDHLAVHVDEEVSDEPVVEATEGPAVTAEKDDQPEDSYDAESYAEFEASLNSDGQRLAVLAYTHSAAKSVEIKGEKKMLLPASAIKEYANAIAQHNEIEEIKDIGGIITAFTQEGTKKSLGILTKGARVGKGSNYYLDKSFVPLLKPLLHANGWKLPWGS